MHGESLGIRSHGPKRRAIHPERLKQLVADHLVKGGRTLSRHQLSKDGIADVGVVKSPPRTP